MQLPSSEELNIGYLSRLFGNTTNCYKFFWFRAILEKLDITKTTFTFDELINEMIVNAWYMVTEYHLQLGPNGITDNLEEVVKYIFKENQFASSEKKETLFSYLKNSDDKKIQKYKQDLTINVPYRLQAPFYDEIKVTDKFWYGPKNLLTEEINRQKRLMYYFKCTNGLQTVIEIAPNWIDYLLRNKEIILGWLELNLIHYLQKKNPSVPGIADKLKTPEARKMDKVRSYWKLIINVDPNIHDIYGNVNLASQPISVDHFVPWQYVAHDELWNLHPTTKSINSSKSNSLPQWDNYFEQLSKLEYRAYQLRDQYEKVDQEFEKCAKEHLNNQKIRNELYQKGQDITSFMNHLDKVLRPVYISAKNCGFKEWVYEK